MFLILFSIAWLTGCDKSYVCNCGDDQGGLPFKKVYLQAKTDNSAERRCTKLASSGEVCKLQ